MVEFFYMAWHFGDSQHYEKNGQTKQNVSIINYFKSEDYYEQSH